MSNIFVLDCSVTISWCFEEEFDQYSQSILASFKNFKAVVPPLWHLEVTNVLLTTERKNKLSFAETTRFLELLNSLPIYTSDLVLSIPEILAAARAYRLTSYDANYLLLAMHEGINIATKDIALTNACKANGVQVKE